MKMSTKGRYGIRVMMDITLHSSQGAVTLRNIARRQDISEKYLWQIVNPLKVAGLIKSIRGACGGYAIAKDPQKITVNEIITALEGAISLVNCVDNPGLCKRNFFCVARDMWRELGEKLEDFMKGITLQDLMERHKKKTGGLSSDYTI